MTAGAAVFAGVIGALFGMVLGSFLGVVRSRGWRGALRGRSRCDGCGRVLRWTELIPLASYAVQGGRCRSCGSPIGREVLLVEVACAAAGAVIAIAGVALLAR